MKPLYSDEEYNQAKGMDKLPCQCYVCKETFYKDKRFITAYLNGSRKNKIKFCSRKCQNNRGNNKIKCKCSNCGKEAYRDLSQVKKYKNQFCSQSCAATYNNKHKTHGTRRSKLEAWLEGQLSTLYPDLEIHYNQKDAINSELDIYIPSFKLAIELNGIFHYEPIFGEDKLKQIQNNDQRKFQACLENKIELLLIDASQLKYFKPKNAQKYLDIITEVINSKNNLLKS